MTERELEKLFRSKLNNREFPVNEENWARMESILDANQVKAGAYYWRSVAAILMFAFSIVGLQLYNAKVASHKENLIVAPSSQEIGIMPMESQTETSEPRDAQDNVTNTSVASSSAAEPKPTAVQAEKANKTLATNIVTSELLSEEVYAESSEVASQGRFESQEGISLIGKSKLPGLKVSFAGLTGLKTVSSLEANTSPISKTDYKGNLFIVAGPVFSGSFNDNTLGTGFQAGLAYQYKFANKLNMELGVNYVRLNNVGLTSQSDSTFFHFGMERVETESLCDQLDYVEIPLSVSYQVLPKHEIGFRGYASLLVNASQETTKTTYASKSGVRVENTSSKGYNEGFNRYDFGIGAFYRYTFNQSFSMGIQVNRGLVDVSTMDDDLTDNSNHVNLNTRIELRYNIF